MNDTIGTIKRIDGGSLPSDFLYCDGALLEVSNYSALASIVGTQYGGDGVKNFALPDLREHLPHGKRGWVDGVPRYVICYRGLYPMRD